MPFPATFIAVSSVPVASVTLLTLTYYVVPVFALIAFKAVFLHLALGSESIGTVLGQCSLVVRVRSTLAHIAHTAGVALLVERLVYNCYLI